VLTRDRQRRRVGIRYLAGSLICFAAALRFGAWFWLLAWPAVALLLVALGYFALGPAVFQKYQGRQSWPARILLLPYLLGAWLSYRLFTRSAAAHHQAVPGVYFGRLPRAGDLNAVNPCAVLDLTAEFSADRSVNSRVYANVPMLDLAVPHPQAINAALRFIDEQIRSGAVYVHCALGLSRSATVIAAWLVRTKHSSSAAEALGYLALRRPGVRWSAAHLDAIANAIAAAQFTMPTDCDEACVRSEL
jgi:hypothetical protein